MDGKVLRSWGAGLYSIPHSIRVDPEGNIWTVDAGNSHINKFTPEGERLMHINVGEMPVITPGDSFDYVSGCPLDTPAGSMQGHYIFVDEEGEQVTAIIPEFSLLSPLDTGDHA